MASPFAFLRSSTNRAHKTAMKLADGQHDSVLDPEKWQAAYDIAFDIGCKGALAEIRRMKKMKEVIEQEFNELMGIETEAPTSGFFITIRPDDSKCDFHDFKKKIESFVSRKCFIEYTYSFEQKGTTPSEIGNGFHCHIVAKMKQRSKGEVLRDTLNTFKDWIEKGWIASNCIDVVITKNPEKLVLNYLVKYESDDGHKVATKAIDELWRSSMAIAPLYVLSRSSPTGQLE